MYYRKTHRIVSLWFVSIFVSSCSGGLDGGSIVGSFLGIQSAIVKGPETVEINWDTNSNCTAYKIYQLSSNTSDSILTITVPPVKVKAPKVESDHIYTFAVGCVDSRGDVSGLNFTKTANTWAKFNGVVTSTLDLTGTSPLVVLNWTYPTATGTAFQVFAQPSSIPGDLSSWALSLTGAPGSAYNETPICETYDPKVKIGPGGNCSTSALVSGSVYNFKIVAKYPDGQFSTDFKGNGTSISIPATFAPPNCILTQEGIGPDVNNSYLYLRCSTGGVVTGGCSINNISTRAYQAINNVRTLVSDVLVGQGTLRIAPIILPTANNDRTVENLEIEYTCTATKIPSKAIIHYDGSSPQFPKPALKYGSTGYESAPPAAFQANPSFLGGAIAVGDFNCDGKPDLAVGLPRVAYNLPPYSNQNSESGAVRIYYDYTLTASGGITSANTQVLSFRDLPTNAHFGQSISSGNINKDVASSSSGVFYSCDDLIIGAPGIGDRANYRGAAYIFYGQPNGFPQPLDSSGLAVNSSTCTGAISSENCAPVRLQPNMTADFRIEPTMTQQNNSAGNGGTIDVTGFSVAYIRDFNADGYGDVAIGNPNCRWDGEAINSFAPTPGSNAVAPLPPTNVGCVYVYWGGPQGLQLTNVGKLSDDLTNNPLNIINSTYVKIYPPFPQSGMHFGWSISGGGDVDGRLPVPVKQNNGPNIILANGNDFVVGAPDFIYNDPARLEGGKSNTLNWTIDETSTRNSAGCSGTGGICPIDPIVLQGPAAYLPSQIVHGPKTTPPWNGAWGTTANWNGSTGFLPPTGNLLNSTGIAFLYLGRSSYINYNLNLTTPTSGFNLFPNSVLQAYGATIPKVEDAYSNNLKDRQNGSTHLTTSTSIDYLTSPGDSFYNCGPRGGPRGAHPVSGFYKHYSCFAGRNNFSVLYPTGSQTVQRFGTNVSIAGAAEQNAVALFQMAPLIQGPGNGAGYANPLNGSKFDLHPFSLGKAHERIRGTSMWELGIRGLNVSGPADASNCETTTNPSSQAGPQPGCAGGWNGALARSILDENYSFNTTNWNPIPSATPISDINKDGYADILITAKNQVYTFFGNYAADFSYQGTLDASPGSCTIVRPAFPAGGNLAASASPTPSPFATFTTRAAGYNSTASSLGSPDYIIFGEYPQFILPPVGQYVRASYLGDSIPAGTGGGLVYNYATVTRPGGTGANCLPQIKNYSNLPTSLAVGDVNGDGQSDAVIGFSNFNNNNGLTVASLGGAGGSGLAFDSNFTVSDFNTSLGTSVNVSNWKFLDPATNLETTRRDVFAGATGYSSGSGAVYAFSGAGNSILSSASVRFLENSNSPNLLGMEYSKIIGDINGDGYDDIWVPIKKFNSSGVIYYDAMIYFGSPFGPMTYTNCIAKLSSLTILGGSAAQASDCAGAPSPQVALMGGVQIRLPQYVTIPLGVGLSWALGVFPAGDVNRDGYQDLIVLDATFSGKAAMYLFFGSSSGLLSGQPILGPSLNQTPQLVSQTKDLVANPVDGNNIPLSNWTVAMPSWYASNNAFALNGRQLPITDRPVVHGDFNGDGYEDIAYSVPSGYSAGHIGAIPGGTKGWTCTPGMATSTDLCVTGVVPGGAYPTTNNSSNPLPGAGYVIILYGSPTGYQTPTDVTTGFPMDFPPISEDCNDLLTNCTPTPAMPTRSSFIKSPYGSLSMVSPGNYNIDTNLTACSPSLNAGSAYTCTGEYIRNPIFFNDPVNSNFSSLSYMLFGSSLTVMDVNNDGIDDLVVGMPRSNLPGLAGATVAPVAPLLINGIQTSDQPNKGGVFIYYGAKGAGLVAPPAKSMLGDTAMGVTGAAAIPTVSAPVFQIYPQYPGAGSSILNNPNSASFLETDAGGNFDFGRNFGIGVSSGDFNGDGVDDLAVVSGNGQIYIYYGPLCQIDNGGINLGIMYSNVNKACLTDTTTNLAMCGSSVGSIPANQCSQLNFNPTLGFNAASNANPIVATQHLNKPLYTQMLFLPASTQTTGMGSTMMSKRPIRSPGSLSIIKNPGNINGDPEGTSDLVLGTYFQNDPNLSVASTSGIGYVFFGHKMPTSATDLPTLPGLYVSPVVNYNGGFTPVTVGTSKYYFYSPVLLKPHTPDGIIGSFFLYNSSMGDLNGDGTADLLLPTRNINFGTDNGVTPVLSGGGFKLIY